MRCPEHGYTVKRVGSVRKFHVCADDSCRYSKDADPLIFLAADVKYLKHQLATHQEAVEVMRECLEQIKGAESAAYQTRSTMAGTAKRALVRAQAILEGE